MKSTATTLLTGLVLVTAAQAGTPITAAAPAPSAGLWQWFAGGSVGYLTDLDEPMYGLHAGAEYKDPGARGSHAIYLQVGFTEDDASYMYPPHSTGGSPPPIGGRTEKSSIDLNIIPITLNYKYEATLTERLNYYLGLGLGIAILDSSHTWRWSEPFPPFNEDNDTEDQTDVRFYGEVFAGLSYEVCPAFEVFAGVRYIFMDNMDQHIDVTNASDYEAGIHNDLLIEAGVRFNF